MTSINIPHEDLIPLRVETEWDHTGGQNMMRYVVYLHDWEVWSSDWDSAYYFDVDEESLLRDWREKYEKFQVEQFKAWLRP